MSYGEALPFTMPTMKMEYILGQIYDETVLLSTFSFEIWKKLKYAFMPK